MNRWSSIEEKSGFINAISCCGKWVAVLMKNKLSLFSVTDGTPLWSTAVQEHSFLSFSPEGEVLASVGEDSTILIFSVHSGELQGQFKPETRLAVRWVSFSPLPHRHIVVPTTKDNERPGKHVEVYSVPDGELLWDCTKDTFCLATYLMDGRVVIVGSNVEVVDGQSGKLLMRAPTVETDSRCFVSASPDNVLLAFDRRNTVVIWSLAENTEVAVLISESAAAFRSGCFSSDSLLFVGGSEDHTIRIWSCSTWICVATLYGHFCPVSSVVFQSDGSGRILSASGDPSAWYNDGTIRIWDVSAVLDGREFDIEVKEGPREVGRWFCQGIPLGGWMEDRPFVFEYPKFKLPEGVKLLDWKIGSGASEREEDMDSVSPSCASHIRMV
jgi:WD40 repeat protein